MIRTSLRTKLVRTMIATLAVVTSATVLVVVGINVVTARRTLGRIEAHLRAGIEEKGGGLVTSQSLAMRDLVADNAFLDVARMVERSVNKDADLVYGLFVDRAEKPWAFASSRKATGFPTDWRRLKIDLSASGQPVVRVVEKAVGEHTVFEFAIAVVDDKAEQLGTLVYGVSDGPLRAALAEARVDSRRTTVWTVAMLLMLGGLTIILGTVLSRRSATRIAMPVTELTNAVNELAAGRRKIRVQIASGDELESLGGAFNHMAGELADSYAQLEEMNHGLEQKVKERTAELERRSRDMRLVLDNVKQGFLTLSRTGTMAMERSAIVDSWFGSYSAPTQFVDYIHPFDSLYGLKFCLGFEAILDDILPLELCLYQLPARLSHDGLEYRCTYFPILNGSAFDGLLVVINDITAELRHTTQENERKEVLAMFEALSKDRRGLLSFVDELDESMTRLPSESIENQKRLLHTIKGTTALMGFSTLSRLAHDMEDLLAERDLPLPGAALEPLSVRWRTLNVTLTTFLGDKGRDILELSGTEVDRVAEMVRGGAPTVEVLDRLASWRLESTEIPMRRLGDHAAALVRRLGKGELLLEIQHNGVRLAPTLWGGFWSDLIHIVRNAVDHGIETPAERALVGKPAQPKLILSTRIDGHQLVVSIKDDGRGIDLGALTEVAIRKGLPHETREDLVAAMFCAGISTRKEVTALSGRGVGLVAVKQALDYLGGTIHLDTTAAEGCCFRFTFDILEIGPRFGIDVDQRPIARAA